VADGAAVLQVRNANYGDLIQSIPVCINRAEGALWKMVSRTESNDVAVFRGSTMKVWNLARLDQKRMPVSIGSDPASSGLAFLDSPQRILQVSAVEPQEGNLRGFNLDVFQIKGNSLERERTLSPISLMTGTAPKFTASLNGRVSVFLLAQGGTQSIHTYQMNAEGECTVSTNPMPVTLVGFHCVSPEGDKVWGGNGFYAVPSGNRIQTADRQDTPPGVFSTSGGVATCWTDNEHVVEVALVKNGNAADGAQRSIVLWSAGQAAPVVSVAAPRAIAVTASPDGLLLAEGSDDGRVRIRDAKTLEVRQILRVHDSPVSVLAWHPTLPRLATSSADLSVKIWNVQTELLEESLALLDKPLSQLHWSGDGRILALSMYGLRCFVNPKSGQ
jgi:WD40 repeat protein